MTQFTELKILPITVFKFIYFPFYIFNQYSSYFIYILTKF